MRGGRVAPASLQRRNALSLHPAKPASLFSLRRHRLSWHSLVRRDHRVLVRLARWQTLWYWGWLAGLAHEHSSAFQLHLVVSFAQAHRRRQRRLLLVRSRGRAAARRMARRFVS